MIAQPRSTDLIVSYHKDIFYFFYFPRVRATVTPSKYVDP